VSAGRALDRAIAALAALAPATARLKGWRRILAALLFGVALAATLPPVHALPLFPVALTGFIWLIGGSRSLSSAFATGFWFGLGFFIAGIYWIGFALMTDAERYGWLVAPAVIGISGGLALFFAIGALIVRALRLDGIWNLLAFSAVWGAQEWIRGHVLSGFPWNLAGSAFGLSNAMNQLVALLGAYGASVVIVFAGGLPSLLAGQGPWQRRAAIPAMLLVLFSIWLGGMIRLAGAPDPSADNTDVNLRIVQPHIAQAEKWRRDLADDIVARHMELTARPSAGRIDLVIWPEAAVPFTIDEDPAGPRYLTEALPQGAVLLTGAPRRAVDATGKREIWNTLHAISPDGRLIGRYDKHHLVPFGEYVPLRSLFNFEKITAGSIDFSEGPGPATLALPGIPPFSPLICYEGIFPDGVIAKDGPRPAWLLNVTNDGWFGVSSGPYQHLASARLRAIEQGLPLVRAANTGISVVVDSYGRERARLGLGRVGIIDQPLPRPLGSLPPYAFIGDWPYFALLIGAFLAALYKLRKKINAMRQNSGPGS